jgi:hypothetical protein
MARARARWIDRVEEAGGVIILSCLPFSSAQRAVTRNGTIERRIKLTCVGHRDNVGKVRRIAARRQRRQEGLEASAKRKRHRLRLSCVACYDERWIDVATALMRRARETTTTTKS